MSEPDNTKWLARHVYCNLCGKDWAAVYSDDSTRLECPECHGDSRINIITHEVVN